MKCDVLLSSLPTSSQAFFPGARANEKLKESGGRCSGNAHFAEHAAEEEVGSKQTQESSAVGPSHDMTRGPEEHDIQEPEEEEESQEQGQQDQQQHHQQQDQQQQHRKGHHEKQIDRSSRSIKRATVESVKSIAGALLGMITFTTSVSAMPMLMLMYHQALTVLIAS